VRKSTLTPGLSAIDRPRGRTQISNVCSIRRIKHRAVESDEDSTHEIISDTEDWLNWNCDLVNPNDSEDDCPADIASDIEQGCGIENLECPMHRDLSATPNVPGLIPPT
jgi:hypothetical protein